MDVKDNFIMNYESNLGLFALKDLIKFNCTIDRKIGCRTLNDVVESPTLIDLDLSFEWSLDTITIKLVSDYPLSAVNRVV